MHTLRALEDNDSFTLHIKNGYQFPIMGKVRAAHSCTACHLWNMAEQIFWLNIYQSIQYLFQFAYDSVPAVTHLLLVWICSAVW